MEFINSRYRAMYEDQGVSVDTIMAVQALQPQVPMDFDHRIKAVQAFRDLPPAKQLAEANKRVANILAKAEGEIATQVQTAYLQEPAEKHCIKRCKLQRKVLSLINTLTMPTIPRFYNR